MHSSFALTVLGWRGEGGQWSGLWTGHGSLLPMDSYGLWAVCEYLGDICENFYRRVHGGQARERERA